MNTKHPEYGFVYELNYGYVPDTKAPDGEEVDAYLVGVEEPVEEYEGRCIAVIHRLNDDDDKLVVVPMSFRDVGANEIQAATHFQEQFFQSELVVSTEK